MQDEGPDTFRGIGAVAYGIEGWEDVFFASWAGTNALDVSVVGALEA